MTQKQAFGGFLRFFDALNLINFWCISYLNFFEFFRGFFSQSKSDLNKPVEWTPEKLDFFPKKEIDFLLRDLKKQEKNLVSVTKICFPPKKLW